MLLPDVVNSSLGIKLAQQRHQSSTPLASGGRSALLHLGRQSRRRIQVKCQRHILRQASGPRSTAGGRGKKSKSNRPHPWRFLIASRLWPNSPRTASRSGSEDAKLDVESAIVDRRQHHRTEVSLLLSVTGPEVWLQAAAFAHRSRTANSQNRNLEIREILLRKTGPVGLLSKFKRFAAEGQTGRGIGDMAFQSCTPPPPAPQKGSFVEIGPPSRGLAAARSRAGERGRARVGERPGMRERPRRQEVQDGELFYGSIIARHSHDPPPSCSTPVSSLRI